NVPQHVALAVNHALERIAADRFGTAHEFADALNNPSFTLSTTSASRGGNATRGRERWILSGAGGLVLLLLATMLWGLMRPANSKQVLRYNIALDSGEAIVPGGSYAGRLALSP